MPTTLLLERNWGPSPHDSLGSHW